MNESFPEKLKRWLLSGGTSAATNKGIVLTEEMKAELHVTSSLARRLHAIKGLAVALEKEKFEKDAIEIVWHLVRDLLDVLEMPPTCRRETLIMFTNYAKGEQDIGYMRMVFIRHIKWCFAKEDPAVLFRFFRAVLGEGRQLQYVEEEVGLLLARWLPLLLASSITKEVLQMTINLLKFQSAYTDDYIISTFMKEAIKKMLGASDEEEALLCLTLVETITAYRYLPIDTLPCALIGLCRIVNVPHLANRIVQIIKNILGTCVGASAYNMLIRMVDRGGDVQLVRSAMFFTSLVLWGPYQIHSLTFKKVDFVRSLYKCLSEESDVKHAVLVLYEVALSLQRMLTDLQPGLNRQSSNLLLDIIGRLYRNTERVREEVPRSGIFAVLRDVVNRLEYLVNSRGFEGNVDKFYRLLDYISHHRPQTSIFKVLDYKKKLATPPDLTWLPNLVTLVKRYFLEDPRPLVNMKTLVVLGDIYAKHKNEHGQIILEAVVAQLFVGFERMRSVQIKTFVVHFLILVGLWERCDAVEEVLQLIGEVIMIKYRLADSPVLNPQEAADVVTAVEGLVKIFRRKTWLLPSSIPISAYNILLTFLENHYKKPEILQKVNQTRLEVFKILFSMKCNDRNHLGFTRGELTGVEERNKDVMDLYSPYVVLSHKPHYSQEMQEEGVRVLSLENLGKIILVALQSEKDWLVLEMLLRELEQKLQQKAIMLAFLEDHMDSLASTLCQMIYDSSLDFPNCLSNTLIKFSRSEFESHLYPVVAVLVAHHQLIRPTTRQQIIRSLQQGVINRYSGQLCIESITLCVMEMPQAMGKQIARIINTFAKITQSVSHSQTMLEFLSTLLHFPSMYSSFVLSQFMSIFAIALPYTNPFKFNHYIVSLAYHVIAMWFLKCPLHIRKNVVNYITNSLTQKFEYMTTTFKPKPAPEKKAKWNRKEKAQEKERQQEEEKNQRKIQVFSELMETCIDLMSRYVFAFCRPVSDRSGTVKMLLQEGKSQTWLAGNKLITITTSGCGGKSFQAGLCDVCYHLCIEGVPQMKKMDLDKIDGRDEAARSNVKVLSEGSGAKASPDSALLLSASLSQFLTSVSCAPPLLHKQAHPSSSPPGHHASPMKSTPSPTRSAAASPTRSAAASPTRSAAASPTRSAAASPTRSAAASPTRSAAASPTRSAAASPTRSAAASPTRSAAASPTRSAAASPTRSAAASPTRSAAASPTRSAAASPTRSAAASPTRSAAASPTRSAAASPTRSAAASPTRSAAASPTRSATASSSKSASPAKSSGSSSGILSCFSSRSFFSRTVSPSSSRPSPSTPSSKSFPCTPTKPSPSSPSAKSFHSTQPSPHRSTKCKSLPPSPSHVLSPSLSSMQVTISSQSLPCHTSPPANPSFSSPTTPQSPSFPFVKYPKYSPVQSSPDVSLVLSMTSESSQDLSHEGSPDKPKSQRTPSPAKLVQSERTLLSRDNLYLPLARLERKAGHKVGQQEVDGRRQDGARGHHEEPPPPPLLPPVPEDEGPSGEAEPQSTSAAGTGSEPHFCACWCKRWAELYIRQPCGNFSVVMRLGDEVSLVENCPPLHQMSEMIRPSKSEENSIKNVADSREPNPGASKSPGGAESVQVEERKQGKTSASPPHHKTPAALEKRKSPKKETTSMFDKNLAKWEESSRGLSPSFVFLQLYYHGMMPTDDSRPILLPTEQAETRRSLSLLDFIKPQDTHKIGVLYVRHRQTTEQEILSNTCGSLRYTQFLSALGTYIELARTSDQVFLGGLDTTGVDGDTALVWHDDLLQVLFHVATMMPTKATDPRCNGKKRHIGNDFVTIVFNESGQDYKLNTIKGQFNHVVIEIVPQHLNTNTVTLHYQPEMLKYLKKRTPRLVSDSSLPLAIRQIAVHSNSAAKIMESLKGAPHKPFANNWVERLRHLNKIRNTVLANIKKSEEKFSAPQLDDFSDLIDVTVRNLELSKDGQYSIQLMYK